MRPEAGEGDQEQKAGKRGRGGTETQSERAHKRYQIIASAHPEKNWLKKNTKNQGRFENDHPVGRSPRNHNHSTPEQIQRFITLSKFQQGSKSMKHCCLQVVTLCLIVMCNWTQTYIFLVKTSLWQGTCPSHFPVYVCVCYPIILYLLPCSFFSLAKVNNHLSPRIYCYFPFLLPSLSQPEHPRRKPHPLAMHSIILQTNIMFVWRWILYLSLSPPVLRYVFRFLKQGNLRLPKLSFL